MRPDGSGPCIRIIPSERRVEIFTGNPTPLDGNTQRGGRSKGKRKEGARALDRQVAEFAEEGLTQTQIARKVGLTVPGVAYRLARLRKLAEKGFVEDAVE